MKIDDGQLREFDSHWKCDEWGKWSRFLSSKETIEAFGLTYKGGTGVKVFVGSKFTVDDLRRICIIQTFYASLDLAPPIYDFGFKNGYYYVEVYLAHNLQKVNNVTKELILKHAKRVGWIIPYEVDLNVAKNYIGNYYLDFHGFEIEWHRFKEWFTDEAKKSHWGKNDANGNRYAYQETEVFKGKRILKNRINQMKLDAVDFDGKTVLDIGCNLGAMSLWAASKGAKVIGVDCFENFKMLADIYKFYKLRSGVEFIEFKLASDTIDRFGKFDIVFYFAMTHSLGIPRKLGDITKNILIFEGHNMQNEKQIRTVLEQIFPVVNLVGFTDDRGKRPVFYCYKAPRSI